MNSFLKKGAPKLSRVTASAFGLSVPDEPVQGLVCAAEGRVCLLHPAFLDKNLFFLTTH